MFEVERHFRPEFLNRIDELIVFNPLSADDLRRIIELQLTDVMQRLAERGIALTLTPEATDFLIKKGYNEDYGARPLRRAIERFIEDPLAEELLRAEGKDGLAIQVGVAEGGETLTFRQEPAREPVGAGASDKP
jgi:ATP-dependent Clp protease ATP-binding subunit ClpC